MGTESQTDVVREARELTGRAVLAMPPSYGMPDVATFDGAKRIDRLITRLCNEIEALRRGEFICSR